MAVVALADVADVEAALGRPLTAEELLRVQAILDKASELFRREAGQQFTPGESTNRLRVRGTQVWLTQRPVTDVTEVVDDDGNPIAYTQFEYILFLEKCREKWVQVTYEHGGAVPDVVRLCIADIAKKVLLIDPSAQTGFSQTQETAGPFQRGGTVAPWAQGAQTTLSPDDVKLARSFRNLGGALVVLEP